MMSSRRLIRAGEDPVVEDELGRLPQMPIVYLRLRYRELFRAEPPKAFGPDLLRRSIAYRIQEKAYGALSRPVRRLLDQMIKTYLSKPGGKLVLPVRIKPGSILVRVWKNNSCRVTVMLEGFAYDGKLYGSLSEIAHHITGTRWNGPRFFGLRTTRKIEAEPPVRKPPLGGGSDYRKRNAVSKARKPSKDPTPSVDAKFTSGKKSPSAQRAREDHPHGI